MSNTAFDEYAEKYDTWFLKNEIVLHSELALLAHFLKKPGQTLSVGCGSGLFEMLLKKEYKIIVEEGLEPSTSMAEIARKRGMTVKIGTAENLQEYSANRFDTVLFNGSPSYISDLKQAFIETFRILKPDGHILVLDVPKESGYALLYNLASQLGTWEHPLLEGVRPAFPYPIEFTKSANWRTTPEKVTLLKEIGFQNFQYAQTLTKHPVYTHLEIETPVEGYEKGGYVAIWAEKA